MNTKRNTLMPATTGNSTGSVPDIVLISLEEATRLLGESREGAGYPDLYRVLKARPVGVYIKRATGIFTGQKRFAGATRYLNDKLDLDPEGVSEEDGQDQIWEDADLDIGDASALARQALKGADEDCLFLHLTDLKAAIEADKSSTIVGSDIIPYVDLVEVFKVFNKSKRELARQWRPVDLEAARKLDAEFLDGLPSKRGPKGEPKPMYDRLLLRLEDRITKALKKGTDAKCPNCDFENDPHYGPLIKAEREKKSNSQ